MPGWLPIPRVIKTKRGKLDLVDLQLVRKRFMRYVAPHWKTLVLAGIAALGAVSMELAGPWPIKLIFDVVLLKENGISKTALGQWFSEHTEDRYDALEVICALILLVALFESVFSYGRDVLLAQTGQAVVGKIRQDLFGHLEKLSPDVFETHPTGDLLTRLTGDIQMLRQMIVDGWIDGSQQILSVICVVAFMFYLNPFLAILGLVTLPVIAIPTVVTSRRIRRATRDQREREGHVASIAHEVINAMSVVQAFNRERVERHRFSRQNRSSVRASLRTTRLEARLYRVISMCASVSTCAVLFFGVRNVLAGAMTAGDLLVFVAYMRSINKPLRRLSRMASNVAKATTCGRRIWDVLEIPPRIVDCPDAIDCENVRGLVELEHVDFVYPDGTQALCDLSLRVEVGERIAIVGESGAGKSTLLKLLLRFYDPTSGSIRIDGVDICRFIVASLRNQMSILQQDNVLFGLTVAENIALGSEEIEMAGVIAAAKAVEAHSFIESLPHGYDTVLSERGTTLSGGQRQRIALARAVMRQAPILILDEPATGLDARTALLAEQAWMSAQGRRTTLVICHQLNAMQRFDRIVVLSRGAVIASGAHAELLAQCPTYNALHRAWAADAKTRAATKGVPAAI